MTVKIISNIISDTMLIHIHRIFFNFLHTAAIIWCKFFKDNLIDTTHHIYTGCSNTIYPFLISNFDTVNIILSIWEFNQFLYMLLGVLSQNVIGMGWKMNDLRMSILTWVKFKCAPFLATLKKAVSAVVEPLQSRFCG